VTAKQPPAEVRDYIEAIPAEHRPLFDRVQRLVFEQQPDVEVAFLYKMPTYRRGRNRFFIANWKGGVSLYGWKGDQDGGFTARHPELLSAKSTIQLTPDAAAKISDDELRRLISSAFA
jgi:hypothetical protein